MAHSEGALKLLRILRNKSRVLLQDALDQFGGNLSGFASAMHELGHFIETSTVKEGMQHFLWLTPEGHQLAAEISS